VSEKVSEEWLEQDMSILMNQQPAGHQEWPSL